MYILLAFLIIICAVLLCVLRFMKMRQIEQENQLLQAYMVSLQSFYSMIQSRIEAVRRYRHDLAKHIQTLEVLLAQEEAEDIREYADDLKIRYQVIKNEEYCSDEVVNTVLSIKKQQCEEKEIPFEICVENGIYGGINSVEMVGILYNLLDNAVEASEQLQEKGIVVLMSEKDSVISIEVQNRVQPGQKINLETSKSDKEAHGVGLRIVEYLVKKNHGKLEFQGDQKTGVFSVKTVLRPE